MNTVFNGDCRDLLNWMTDYRKTVPLIFADPPDNLGLDYGEYKDKIPEPEYYGMLYEIIVKSLPLCTTFWLSYYWQHDLEIKHMVRDILKFYRPSAKAKTFIWRYTFGQHKKTDFGSGFRFMLRIVRPGAIFNPDDIKVESARQKLGDNRANLEGKVPDDVWSFGPAIFDVPRVVGNGLERRPWHPTQHPEALISRIVRMHSNSEDRVIDLFGGTGTIIRAAKQVGRKATVSEIDSSYAKRICEDTDSDFRNQFPIW